MEKAAPSIALNLRPERDEDRGFLLALFRDARPELALLPLDPAGLDRLIGMQFDAQNAAYREQYPQAEASIVEVAGQPIGRLFVDRTGGELHLVDIALVTTMRGRGIGTQLLRTLIDEARRGRTVLRLSVATGNTGAFRLYSRLGFAPTGRDAMYIRMEWRP